MATTKRKVACASFAYGDTTVPQGQPPRQRMGVHGEIITLDTDRAKWGDGKGWLTSPDDQVEPAAVPLTPPAASPTAATAPTAEEVGAMTVDEVNAYIVQHPDRAAQVVELERTGKNRRGVVGAE